MKIKSVLLLAIMILSCVSLSFAQSGYVKLGDIKGDSSDANHKDWIVIESMGMSMELSKSPTGATRHRGKVQLQDLIIIKKVDKSSPKLAEACAKGMTIPKLELEIVGSNGRTYYKVILEPVRISSVNTHSSDAQLIEEVAFNYSKITWEYSSRDGTTSSSYDSRTGN
ncbi:MAG: type VI secretion system tube protein Hcp [Bacteroidia bacterium]|nr:type VI secretion system tube protein Hcp [Bacteroidia bacterium]NND52956.1 type VI secretion system tube protein Hcp [Flavobacteriaceae bacterium]